MTKPWTPDYNVNRALVEEVVRAQAPDLDVAELTYVGAGWDHEVWRCGDVVLRFPHQDDVRELAARKAQVLAQLAGRLPCGCPAPTHLGEASARYPARFVGYRWLAGNMPARLRLSDEERALAAEPIARSLKALHAMSLDEVKHWGVEPADIEGELALRTENAQLRAEQLSSSKYATLAREAADAMLSIPAEVTDSGRRLVHGDLHAGQLLFDDERRFVGIIDWDEVSIGDPAYDLLLVYAFLPRAARAPFWRCYGSFEGKDRARHLAVSYGLAILAQAVDTHGDELRDEAAYGLANALS